VKFHIGSCYFIAIFRLTDGTLWVARSRTFGKELNLFVLESYTMLYSWEVVWTEITVEVIILLISCAEGFSNLSRKRSICL
jgi:TRAP-type mannitol/chloroaromatic compound transport system permease large subunit